MQMVTENKIYNCHWGLFYQRKKTVLIHLIVKIVSIEVKTRGIVKAVKRLFIFIRGIRFQLWHFTANQETELVKKSTITPNKWLINSVGNDTQSKYGSHDVKTYWSLNSCCSCCCYCVFVTLRLQCDDSKPLRNQLVATAIRTAKSEAESEANFLFFFQVYFFCNLNFTWSTIRFPFPIITNSLPFCVERNFYTKYLIVYSDSLGENKFCLFEKMYYYSAVYNLLRFRDMFGQHIVRTL